MDSRKTLNSVNALAVLLLLFGFLLLNNLMATWTTTWKTAPQTGTHAYNSLDGQSAEPLGQPGHIESARQQYRRAQMLQVLHIASAVFLILLGVQMLFKKCWACHFFVSIRQISQLSLLFIPMATMLLLFNRPLIQSMVQLYRPIILQMIQQQYASQSENLVLSDSIIRTGILISFGILGALGITIAALVKQLSNRCLQEDVQAALWEISPQPAFWSIYIICLPADLLLLLPISLYGTAVQLIEIIQTFMAGGSFFELLLRSLAFAGFALALLQLTHRQMQQTSCPAKFRLLKKALYFCGMAHLMQLLQNIVQWGANAGMLGQKAVIAAVSQLNVLGNILFLMLLAVLYYMIGRIEKKRYGSPQNGRSTVSSPAAENNVSENGDVAPKEPQKEAAEKNE